MVKRKTELSVTAVGRLGHVEDSIRVQKKAAQYMTKAAEEYIKNVYHGALVFTKHRKGNMIMLQDITSYFQTQHR